MVFNRVIRDVTEKVTFERRSEGRLRHADMWWWGVIPGRGYIEHRSPETHDECA